MSLLSAPIVAPGKSGIGTRDAALSSDDDYYTTEEDHYNPQPTSSRRLAVRFASPAGARQGQILPRGVSAIPSASSSGSGQRFPPSQRHTHRPPQLPPYLIQGEDDLFDEDMDEDDMDQDDGMCIICKIKPSYVNGSISYPTCGNKCAQELKTRCEVCLVKKKYVDAKGNARATCGNTCRAKLQTIQKMCTVCKKKPKLTIGNKTYEQCGRTCRDLAQGGTQRGPPPQAYPVPTPRRSYPQFAPQAPRASAVMQGPCLVQLVPGTTRYEDLADQFSADWTSRLQDDDLPTIHSIFKIQQDAQTLGRHSGYKAHLDARRLPVTESRRWVAVTYKCPILGRSPGTVSAPCRTYGCSLCDIVIRNVFNPVDYPGGFVPLSGHANRADKATLPQASNSRHRMKAMLFTKVIVGNDVEMTQEEVDERSGSPPDVIQLVRHKNGMKQVSDRLLVFNNDAISPRFLILYK